MSLAAAPPVAPVLTYTVFGFGSSLDWRPTAFVNAIPTIRVCSACGLVPSTAAVLPCHHGLCPPCFGRSTDGECGQCPVDKQRFESDDVPWSTFGQDSLLNRKIHCWNANHGCEAVGAASKILEHFNRHCQYHVVSCHRCGMDVAHRDIISHLDYSSCLVTAEQSKKDEDRHSNVTAAPAEAVETSDNTLKENSEMSRIVSTNISEGRVSEQLSAGAIKTQLLELHGAQARISEERSEVSAALVSIRAKIDALADEQAAGNGNVGNKLHRLEALIDQCKTLGKTSGQALADIQENFDRKLSNLEAASKAIFLDLRRESTPLEWTISGWSELKEEARREKKADYVGTNATYFHGYCVLPAVRIETIRGVQWVRLVFWLHQGAYDHLLSWPIRESFSLKIVKSTGECFEQYIRADTSLGDLKGFQRPKTLKNNCVISNEKIELSKIEENDCVNDDNVRVRFQVE